MPDLHSKVTLEECQTGGNPETSAGAKHVLLSELQNRVPAKEEKLVSDSSSTTG